MTLREYINELKLLDLDRNVWCITNDPYGIKSVPPGIELAEEGDERLFKEDGLKKGDYIITDIVD